MIFVCFYIFLVDIGIVFLSFREFFFFFGPIFISIINFSFAVTNSGKIVKSSVRGWLPKPSNLSHIVEFAANFTVPVDFGNPGAILVTNLHGKEFYLLEIVIHGFDGGPFFFPANTWIHSRKDNPESRIIFKNQVRKLITILIF